MQYSHVAAAYIRVSTDDQLEFSPNSQLKNIREYAKRNDIFLDDNFVFIDEGISGRKAEKRPEFMRMIATAKINPTPFDVILVWKFSRFARNREDSIVYKSMLRKQCGVDVVSISEQVGEDKTSILIEALLEAMDEYYSINLAEEVRRGMNEKFSRGGVVSPPPFGYKMGDNKFIPDVENARIVQMIFEDFLCGLGTRQIAIKLNNMGICSIKGNAFENRTVEYILTNPIYIGKFRRNLTGHDRNDRFHQSADTVIVDGKHQPIISKEIFTEVQTRILQKKNSTPKYAKTTCSDYMLKGLVRCSNCGGTLTQAIKGASLQCSKYSHGNCNVSHSIKMDTLNDAVLEKISEDLSCDNNSILIKSQPVSHGNSLTFQLIEKERKKLIRTKDAYELGIDSLEEYSFNKNKILTKIKELEHTIPQPEYELFPHEFCRKADEVMLKLCSKNIAESDKNYFLNSFISEIVFNRKDMTFQIIYKL